MIGKQAYIHALKDSYPDMIKDKALAEQIVDIFFSIPIKALENGDNVEIPGIGVIKIDKSKGANCLSYEPAGALIKCIRK